MCHTLSLSRYKHQYYQQFLSISTFHWPLNKPDGKKRQENVKIWKCKIWKCISLQNVL